MTTRTSLRSGLCPSRSQSRVFLYIIHLFPRISSYFPHISSHDVTFQHQWFDSAWDMIIQNKEARYGVYCIGIFNCWVLNDIAFNGLLLHLGVVQNRWNFDPVRLCSRIHSGGTQIRIFVIYQVRPKKIHKWTLTFFSFQSVLSPNHKQSTHVAWKCDQENGRCVRMPIIDGTANNQNCLNFVECVQPYLWSLCFIVAVAHGKYLHSKSLSNV